jgi:nucleoside-diphosphate-sugar epimerase
MKIFVAGATGAIGKRLVPMLVARGDEVVGMTSRPDNAEAVRSLGAEPAIANALDPAAVMRAVTQAEPDVVVHQLTALKNLRNLKKFDDEFAVTNRLRTKGTAHLITAARAAGARRLVAQSYGGWTYAPTGGGLKTEDDPLDPDPPARQRESLAALRQLEQAVLGVDDLEGVVLRYANFYGPGTGLEHGGSFVEMVTKRRMPLVGDGGGVWSWVHIDDAARATIAAIDRGTPGSVYNICDDEPLPVAVWLPELAQAVGAKPPRRVPVWIGRLAAGEVGVSMMTRIRGVSNAKARRELGWSPEYPSVREGFRTGLGDLPVPSAGRAGAQSAA